MLRQGVGATVAAAVLAIVPATAVAAKPDLIVTSQSVVDAEYFFRGEGTNVGFSDRTRNKGKEKAGPSKTSLVFLHPPQVRETVVTSRSVPKLNPDKSDFGSNTDPLPDSFPPGAYNALICADYKDKVKEKNEDNNCADLGQVYVIVRSWVGQLSGSGPTAGGFNERWESNDVDYQFAENLGDGRFRYLFNGSVTYTASGTDGEGCEVSGSDTASFTGGTDVGGQGLILDYRKEEYFGNSGIGGFPFTWRRVCEGFLQDEVPGPLSIAGGFIVVNPQEVDTKEMRFG
jgi:CARDB